MVPLRGLMTQQKAGSPPLWAVRGENEAQTWPTSTQRLRVTTARQQTALLGREGPRAITFPCGLHGLSVAFRAQACTQSCLTLCDPVDCSPPGSSDHGIGQARILKRVAMPSSRGSSQCRDRTCISYVSFISYDSCIGRWFLYQQRYLGST